MRTQISERVSGVLGAARGVARRAISPWGGIARRVRASAWTGPLIKLAGVGAALALLAWLGERAVVHAAVAPGSAPALSATSAAAAGPASSAIPAAAPAPAAPAAAPLRASDADPVVLNTATTEDLERLPGVGPKRARAILEQRARQGRFRQVEDLMKVRGIGRATLRRLRPLVRLDPPEPRDAGPD